MGPMVAVRTTVRDSGSPEGRRCDAGGVITVSPILAILAILALLALLALLAILVPRRRCRVRTRVRHISGYRLSSSAIAIHSYLAGCTCRGGSVQEYTISWVQPPSAHGVGKWELGMNCSQNETSAGAKNDRTN